MRELAGQRIDSLLLFPFRQERWAQKLLIAIVISLASAIIPILPNILLEGYVYQIMHRVIKEGKEFYLPDWQNPDQLFRDGLRLFGARFVAAAPWMLVIIPLFALFLLPAMLIGLGVLSGWEIGDTVGGLLSAMPMLGVCLLPFIVIAGLAYSLILPAAAAHVVAREDFYALFQVQEWWLIFRANFPGYLITFCVMSALGFILSLLAQFAFLTIILICILPILIAIPIPYLSIVGGAFSAAAYQAGKQNLENTR
jgi:hypothetical protein